jgi:hypothetical protein
MDFRQSEVVSFGISGEAIPAENDGFLRWEAGQWLKTVLRIRHLRRDETPFGYESEARPGARRGTSLQRNGA